MSDATRRVLDLLAQGKITVDEATELLKAIRDADAASADQARGSGSADRPTYIRIAVRKRRGADAGRRVHGWPGCMSAEGPNEVNIRVPMALVRNGLRLGAFVPGGADLLSNALRERGFNIDSLSKITPEQLETMLREMGELTVDVDHGRAEVRISAE